MSMYDLAVPTTVYDKQIQQLTSQIATIEDNDDLVSVTSQTTSKFQVVRGIFYLIGIYCTAIKHDKTITIQQYCSILIFYILCIHVIQHVFLLILVALIFLASK